MQSNYKIFLCVSILLLLVLAACSDTKTTQMSQVKLTDQQVSKVLSEKIFFGHKSVGDNLLDGIRDVMASDPRLTLKLVKSESPESIVGPALVEAHIGENGKPASKNEAFLRILNQGMGMQGGIALYKYCYVDFGANTDASQVFADYQKGIAAIHQAHPALKIVHVTAPLTTVEPAPKAMIKGFLGRPTLRDENVKRNQFNRLLEQTYAGKEPIFDLAKIESTHSDGSREYFTRGGQDIYTLAPEFTSDGGHLNQAGRLVAAEQLLRTLADL